MDADREWERFARILRLKRQTARVELNARRAGELPADLISEWENSAALPAYESDLITHCRHLGNFSVAEIAGLVLLLRRLKLAIPPARWESKIVDWSEPQIDASREMTIGEREAERDFFELLDHALAEYSEIGTPLPDRSAELAVPTFDGIRVLELLYRTDNIRRASPTSTPLEEGYLSIQQISQATDLDQFGLILDLANLLRNGFVKRARNKREQDKQPFNLLTVCITYSGRDLIEELIKRRKDSGQRVAALRRGMLMWLMRREELGEAVADWEGFVRSNPSHLAGWPYERREIDRQIEYLQHAGLVSTAGSDHATESGRPSLRLSSRGHDCVVSYDGDTNKYLEWVGQKMSASEPRSGDGFHVTVNGNVTGTQVALGNKSSRQQGGSFEQVIAPGFENIAAIVAQLVEDSARLPLGDDGREDIRETGAEILSEVQKKEPDRGKVRRWVATLRALLAPIAEQAHSGVGDGAHELARQAIEALGNAAF